MRIRIVYNKVLPLGDNQSMSVWPWIFVKKAVKDYVITHELIHCQQQKEVMAVTALVCCSLGILGVTPLVLLAIPFSFYALYGLEYLIRLSIYRNHKEAYRNISTEQEAYLHQFEAGYPMTRRDFAWQRFIFKKTYKA
jgi:hypothetical protein